MSHFKIEFYISKINLLQSRLKLLNSLFFCLLICYSYSEHKKNALIKNMLLTVTVHLAMKLYIYSASDQTVFDVNKFYWTVPEGWSCFPKDHLPQCPCYALVCTGHSYHTLISILSNDIIAFHITVLKYLWTIGPSEWTMWTKKWVIV